MEQHLHNMNHLFAQLGRANDDAAIARFIESHRPLPGGIELHEASFWSDAQASFLREAVGDDADWAEAVEELNAELHDRHSYS